MHKKARTASRVWAGLRYRPAKAMISLVVLKVKPPVTQAM
jgi:hypothetical protein